VSGMAYPQSRSKVIQVQKPAQSLQAFQQKVASGEDVQVGLLKPLLIGAGALVLAAAGYFVITTMRANTLEKHQTALADLQLEVSGDLSGNGEPASPQELEQRMRERLPRLEALAKSAPAGDKALSEGLLATWRLQLGVQGGPAPLGNDPWSQLRVAQRQIALGQGKEASATLAPLRSAASPDKAWAQLFWSNQLTADQLLGDRTQAWKDLGEYKALFKGQADPTLDRQLAGV
jgi:hypothetical protein